MKKLSVTELLATRQIERSRSVRHQEIARFLRKMIRSAEKLEVVDVGTELMKIINNIICRLVTNHIYFQVLTYLPPYWIGFS